MTEVEGVYPVDVRNYAYVGYRILLDETAKSKERKMFVVHATGDQVIHKQ